MAEAPSQPGGTNPDESWDKFLHLVSGLETSESDLGDAEASGDLDAPRKTSSAPQHHLATAGSSKSTGSLSAPVDKVENRRMIQKRYREREKVGCLHDVC